MAFCPPNSIQSTWFEWWGQYMLCASYVLIEKCHCSPKKSAYYVNVYQTCFIFCQKKKNRDQQIALIVCLCLTGSAVESVTLPVISVWEGEVRVWVDRLVWMWPWIISPFLYLSEFYTLKYYFVVWIEFLAEDNTAHSHVKDH